MTSSLQTSRSTVAPIKKTLEVQAPIDVAFRVFTSEMTVWWQLESHHIGKVNAVAAVVEPHVGGRWYERGADGSECDWGKVLAWEPPVRVVLAWQISAAWQFDPSLHTEVEVQFVDLGSGSTRVELEHRLLQAYGAKATEMQQVFESPQGWGRILEQFGAAAASARR